MRLDPVTGWCAGVRHCPSAHCNERPQGEISLLVLHNIRLSFIAAPDARGPDKTMEISDSIYNLIIS